MIDTVLVADKTVVSAKGDGLDLTTHPDVKFVRAHWEVARWGRGVETPMFEFGLSLKEVPAQVLREAAAEAKAPA